MTAFRPFFVISGTLLAIASAPFGARAAAHPPALASLCRGEGQLAKERVALVGARQRPSSFPSPWRERDKG